MALLLGGLQAAIAAPFRGATARNLSSMSNEAKICALISEACYEAPSNRPASIQGYALDSDINGTEFCAYVSDRRVIVGFKGTDTGRDVVVDAGIVMSPGMLNPRMMGNERMYGMLGIDLDYAGLRSRMGRPAFGSHDRVRRDMTSKYPGKEIFITGHSLGGAYACEMAVRLSVSALRCETAIPALKVHVFNSAPNHATGDSLPQATYTHHHIFGDPISCTTGNALGLELIVGNWTTITYSPHPRASSRHSIDNFTQ